MFKVEYWPLGEDEDDGGKYPEIYHLHEFPAAILRGVGLIADSAHALIDPANGDAPSDEEDHGGIADYVRNGSMAAFAEIYTAADDYFYDKPRLPVQIYGASTEVVTITKEDDEQD